MTSFGPLTQNYVYIGFRIGMKYYFVPVVTEKKSNQFRVSSKLSRIFLARFFAIITWIYTLSLIFRTVHSFSKAGRLDTSNRPTLIVFTLIHILVSGLHLCTILCLKEMISVLETSYSYIDNFNEEFKTIKQRNVSNSQKILRDRCGLVMYFLYIGTNILMLGLIAVMLSQPLLPFLPLSFLPSEYSESWMWICITTVPYLYLVKGNFAIAVSVQEVQNDGFPPKRNGLARKLPAVANPVGLVRKNLQRDCLTDYPHHLHLGGPGGFDNLDGEDTFVQSLDDYILEGSLWTPGS
ncbi:unnamed protein product, partial [Allacma fusca]